MNIAEFSRTPILKNICERVLLHIQMPVKNILDNCRILSLALLLKVKHNKRKIFV